MLLDLINALINAETEKDKERAYRNLEKVGMDRVSANCIMQEMLKESK